MKKIYPTQTQLVNKVLSILESKDMIKPEYIGVVENPKFRIELCKRIAEKIKKEVCR